MRKQVKILAVALGAALVIVVGIFSFQFIRTGSDADLGPRLTAARNQKHHHPVRRAPRQPPHRYPGVANELPPRLYFSTEAT